VKPLTDNMHVHIYESATRPKPWSITYKLLSLQIYSFPNGSWRHYLKSSIQLQSGLILLTFSLDYDECAQITNPCDQNADCINTVGSYRCQCHTGYTGDGHVCTGNVIKNSFVDRRLNMFNFPQMIFRIYQNKKIMGCLVTGNRGMKL
jgi:hypothetical protein